MMDTVSKDVIEFCKSKLLELRQETMNNIRDRADLEDHLEGDEGDMAQTLQNQDAHLIRRENNFIRLKQIDMALARIENGTYGICEETEEIIEPDRLKAIPWTSLSIEGAEIREQRQRRFG